MANADSHALFAETPPPAPAGATQWLAETLRCAHNNACDEVPTREKRYRAAYIVGYLAAEAELSDAEVNALLESVTR